MTRGVVPPSVPLANDGLEAWAAATVPFATTSPAGMAPELAAYLVLGAHVAEWLPEPWYVHLSVEPDWDGCDGRWVTIDQATGGPHRGSLCAARVLDGSVDQALAERTKRVLAGDGWDLLVEQDGEEPWGFWQILLPSDPIAAAEMALTPALDLFDVPEPSRWFVSMTVGGVWRDDDGSGPPRFDKPITVDLRTWRTINGLPTVPATIAPHGTEPWAILCEAGLHHLHAAPCSGHTACH